jgi:hypothetical protein
VFKFQRTVQYRYRTYERMRRKFFNFSSRSVPNSYRYASFLNKR